MIVRLVKSMVKKNNKVVLKHGLKTTNVKVQILIHPKDMPKTQPVVKVTEPDSITLIFEDPEIIKSCWDVVITKTKRISKTAGSPANKGAASTVDADSDEEDEFDYRDDEEDENEDF